MGKNILLTLFLPLLLSSCAKQSSPGGGPKDEAPPEVLASQPPNESTNFQSLEVNILFNEFIQLKNPRNNIIISPPLNSVKYHASRKELTISLPDSLKANTTYKINFGEAIQDLNEGNVLSNFSYVFATGSFLDSLTFSGSVVDAYSKEPVKNVKVCLYTSIADSFVFKNNPAYFATTDEKGNYTITNIREDTFYVFAFTDENNNFRYDPKFESLAFREKPFYIDSNIIGIDLRISPEVKPFPKFTCQSIGPATILLKLDRPKLPAEQLIVAPIPSFRDSLLVDSTLLFFETMTTARLSFVNYQGDTFSQECNGLREERFSLFQSRQHNQQLELLFTSLIDTVLKLPLVTVDSIESLLEIDSIRNNNLYLTLPPKATKLHLEDSSIVSRSGHFLLSSNVSLKIGKSVSQSGTLTLILVDSSESSSPKILYLTRGQHTVKHYLKPHENQIEIPHLATGEYTVKVLFDANQNHAWDPAIFSLRKQPEPVIHFPDKIEVKTNWEQEIRLDLTTE